MKQFDFSSDDDVDEDSPEMIDDEMDNQDEAVRKVASQKATWREIEKRRELIALSRMVGESIDDQIFME